MDDASPNKSAFVTVGSTTFPELIEAITSPTSLQTLQQKGFKKLIIQRGLTPIELPLSTDLIVETFDYHPKIEEMMQNFDLIISHAGTFGTFPNSRF